MLTLLLGGVLAVLSAAVPLSPAAAASYRLIDPEGVTHFTNAPTDPRYRRIPGMSGTLSGWLRLPDGAAGKYVEEIREISARYSLPPRLVESVIRVESAFNPSAVSRKGAQGLMQLMPQTASSLGVRDAFNPRQNIEGGVRHLRYLMERFPGNLPLALAAYNAGEAAVAQYRGIPPYPETEQYVRKVLELHGGGEAPQVIYRHEDPDGTVTYTNIRPPAGFRVH